MEVFQVFSEYLRQRDLKNTPERMMILQEIQHRDDHFQADDLLFYLRNKNIKVSRATVYRTLELLCDCGILSKVNFESSSTLFESTLKTGHHDHFICMRCRKIIEFYDDAIREIHQRIAGELNFEIESYTHHIYGVCGECKQKTL
jgi:Fur family ferric uptake transcriptional regulator